MSRVEVVVDAGTVTAVPGDELVVQVSQRSGLVERRPTITRDTSDGALRVTGSCPRIGLGRCETRVTVSLPPDVAIAATTRAGAIGLAVPDASYRVDARTKLGRTRIDVPPSPMHDATSRPDPTWAPSPFSPPPGETPA